MAPPEPTHRIVTGARSAGRRAGVALLGVAVALGAAELAIRFGLPQPRLAVTPGLTTPDPPGRYRLTPGYEGVFTNRVEYAARVVINQRGLRGPELGPREDELRVLAIGDSFTFGTGVEQHEVFIERAPAELRSAGYPALALNAGTPGFGPPDASSWLERHGRDLDPDVVVLGVFLGNDLQDALRAQGTFRPAVGGGTQTWAGGLHAWLNEHSHAFTLLQRTVPLPWQRLVRAWFGHALPPEDRHLERELEALQRNPPSWTEAALAELDGALARLANRATPTVAVLIPSDLQLDGALRAATAAHLGFEPELDADRPRRLFGELLTRHSLPFLDLTEPLQRRYDAGDHLYYRYDRHWTALAHAIAGRELARFLRERGLLRSRSRAR